MRLEQLEYLLEVSRVQSISLASKNLHISQQALSRTIQGLEEELGIDLLLRTSKGVTMTPAGEKVKAQAKIVLKEVAQLKDCVQPFKNIPAKAITGNLNLHYTGAFPMGAIHQAINAFAKVYPHISIAVHKVAVPSIIANIVNGFCDIGFIALTNDTSVNQKLFSDYSDQIQATLFAEDRMTVAVSHLSPLAKQKSISVGSLLTHPMILILHQSTDCIEDTWLYMLLKVYGEPQIILKTNDYGVYRQAIADNVGVGVYTNEHIQMFNLAQANDIVLLSLREPIQVFYQYIVAKNRPLSSAVQMFLPFLQALK